LIISEASYIFAALNNHKERDMTKNGLDDFFKAKKKRAKGDVDWDKKRDEWIKYVENLYKVIEKYLANLLKDKTVSILRSPTTIEEDNIGKYSIDELKLCVGDEKVLFSPKGRDIVGASGRVDIVGEMGRKTLVLQPGNRWMIVATRIPTLKLVRFNANNLLKALQEIMRP